jgi:hypothetical protein
MIAEKAEARRARLRRRVQARTADTQIEAAPDRVVDTAVLKIGQVRITTNKRPGKSRRGVDLARRKPRNETQDA